MQNKLTTKPIPNQEQITNSETAEIVKDQKNTEEELSEIRSSDTKFLTEEQKLLDSFEKDMNKKNWRICS